MLGLAFEAISVTVLIVLIVNAFPLNINTIVCGKVPFSTKHSSDFYAFKGEKSA